MSYLDLIYTAIMGVLAIMGAAYFGKYIGRRDAKKEIAQRADYAEDMRTKLEEDIDEDTDLAGRARRAGLVRKE